MTTSATTLTISGSVGVLVAENDGTNTLIANLSNAVTVQLSSDNPSSDPTNPAYNIPLPPGGTIVLDGTKSYYAIVQAGDSAQVAVIPGGVSYFQLVTLIVNSLIVTGESGGVFVYNGTPGLGNPPVLSISVGDVDPYGNPVQSILAAGVAGVGQMVVTDSGVLELQDASGNPLIQLNPALAAILLYAPTSGPIFGMDAQAPWSTVEAALGVIAIPGWKGYNSGVPTSNLWPGADNPIPAGVTTPLACFKPAIQATAPYIDSTDATNLAACFAAAPVGSYSTCWQEGELHSHGFTAAQIIGMHVQAYAIFKANAPAGAFYVQDFSTYGAYAGCGPTYAPMSTYVCSAHNGGVDLDAYFADWYPNTNGDATATSSIEPWLSELTTGYGGATPVIGISETNYLTGGGITWTQGDALWFEQSYAWAQANDCIIYWPYYYNVNGVPWPPSSEAIAVLTQIAGDSGQQLVESIASQGGVDTYGDDYLEGSVSYGTVGNIQIFGAAIQFNLLGSVFSGSIVQTTAGGAGDVPGLLITSPTDYDSVDDDSQAVIGLAGESANADNGPYIYLGSGQSTAADIESVPVLIVGGKLSYAAPGVPGGSLVAETWHTATPETNWTGSIYYRLLPDGDVELAGTAVGSAPNSSPNMFSLPAAYRPANATCYFPVLQTSGSYTDPGISVATGGTVEWVASAGSGTVTARLDGIRIPVSRPT
jgi:hypothetical protein